MLAAGSSNKLVPTFYNAICHTVEDDSLKFEGWDESSYNKRKIYCNYFKITSIGLLNIRQMFNGVKAAT
jgi:hypothetical protein